MNKQKIPTPENFQDWLDFMDYELQLFLDDLPLSVEEQLDYSVRSLSVLEKFILDQYETIEDIMADGKFWNRAARYVGEVICRNSAAEWWQCREEKNAFYGMAVVGRKGLGPESPHSLVSACTTADRRTGHFIENIVRRFIANIGTNNPAS